MTTMPQAELAPPSPQDARARLLRVMMASSELAGRILDEVERAVVGKRPQLELILAGLLADGHVLLDDLPGVAKTLTARSIATAAGLTFSRVQFTPDVLPSDITGATVLDLATNVPVFRAGPVFAQLVLADEINRAPAKTQAALLEAMQEYQVTVNGVRYELERPLFVLATQNPIEQEGTYPLPEAQLDRFLFEIDVPYPSLEAERRMLFATTGIDDAPAEQVLTSQELLHAQRLTRLIPIGEQVAEGILRIVRAARPGPDADEFITQNVAWGPSPRASQALMLGARAKALLEGRLSPSLDDVLALVDPVFKHRMALSFSARADGHTVASVTERLKSLIA